MSNQFFPINVPLSGNGVGIPQYTGNLAPQKTFVVQGPFNGVLYLEGSTDGIVYAAYLKFTGGPNISYQGEINAILQYVRVRRVGGSALPLPSVTMGAELSSAFNGNTPKWNGISVVDIYVSLIGDDTTGDGSIGNPFRTIERAAQVAAFNFVGPRYQIHADNMGVYTFQPDYEWPAWQSPNVFPYFDFSDPYTFLRQGVSLLSTPQLDASVPAASAIINAGDILAMVANPDNNLIEITLTPAAALAKGWLPGQFKGKFFVGAGGFFENGAIRDNTANTLFICENAFFGFPTTPFQIMEPSTTLQGSLTEFRFFGGDIMTGNVHGMSFSGLGIINPGENGSATWYQLCQIFNPAFSDPMRQCALINCLVDGGFFEGQGYFSGSFIHNMYGDWLDGEKSAGEFSIFNCGMENCTPIKVVNNGTGSMRMATNLILQNVAIVDAQAEAIINSGKSKIEFVTIDNSLLDAILALEGSFTELINVRSPTIPNGGYGVRIDDSGAVVKVDAATDISGAVGDMQVGGFAPRTWADFRAAIPPSGHPQFNEYEITSVGATGATGSGSRLYQ